MQIAIGKYLITSDSYNIIVSKEIERKEKGTDNVHNVMVPIAYYNKLESALLEILDGEIKQSDVKSLEELSKLIKDTRNLIIKTVTDEK